VFMFEICSTSIPHPPSSAKTLFSISFLATSFLKNESYKIPSFSFTYSGPVLAYKVLTYTKQVNNLHNPNRPSVRGIKRPSSPPAHTREGEKKTRHSILACFKAPDHVINIFQIDSCYSRLC